MKLECAYVQNIAGNLFMDRNCIDRSFFDRRLRAIPANRVSSLPAIGVQA
jgi:hypothetical protein